MFFNTMTEAIAYMRTHGAQIQDHEVWMSGSGEVCIDAINAYYIELDEDLEGEFTLKGIVQDYIASEKR